MGLKVNVTTQDVPATNDAAHEVAPLNIELLVPEITGLLVKVSEEVPVFLSVTDCDADTAFMAVDGKVRLVGDMLTATVLEDAPVPLKATVCPEVPALSAKTISADSAPDAAGLNATVTVQAASTARVVPQVLVCENEEELTPAMLTPDMVMEAVPVLVSLTVWTVADEPTAVEEKVRLLGDRVAIGPAGSDAAPGQPFTTLATLSEPRPVALS